MAVRNIFNIRPVVWIPPQYTANWKVTVTRQDGTVDDITDLLLMMKIKNEVTQGIGSFEFTIPNASEDYTGIWTGMEEFKYYCDYDTTATTLRFKGRAEKISYQNSNVKVTGRSNAVFLIEKTVSKSYSNQDVAVILVDLFNNYGESRYDTSQIPASIGVTLAYISWVQKPFWSTVQDLCSASGYECYIDANDVVQFFATGSVVNDDEGLVHDYNLLEVSDFADDGGQVKNRIMVKGANNDGIQILGFAEDTDSQDIWGVREDIRQDSTISTTDQANEYAAFLLDLQQNPPVVGEGRGLLLATIEPGDTIFISSPLDNLPPTRYTTSGYEIDINNDDGAQITVTIEKEPRDLSRFLKKRIEAENAQNDSGNIYEMRYNYGFTFDNDTGSHTNTAISDGVLRPTTASGTWVSPTLSTDANITQVVLAVKAETPTGATYEVSANGGITYETVTPQTLKTMTTALGASLRVRVTFSNADTQIDSLNILYRTA